MSNPPHTPATRPLRKSRLLSILRSGGHAPCIKINTLDPRVVEIAGLAGSPVAWLCNEHVPNDWVNMEQQIRAAKLYDMDTIVRVAKNGYSDYSKPLEADATGIMVPHVTTADEARQVVEWTRFYPQGTRATDGGNADGQFGRSDFKDYMQNGNEERFVILQIESPEGLANIDEIAAVEGFDILHFGPGDFSHRIGDIGNIQHPDVIAGRALVAEAAKRHGKYAMSQAIAPHKELIAQGYQVVTVGADVVGLNNYMNTQLGKFYDEVGPATQ